MKEVSKIVECFNDQNTDILIIAKDLCFENDNELLHKLMDILISFFQNKPSDNLLLTVSNLIFNIMNSI
jgi:predicted AAA+ superfamily ATPase